MCAILKSVMELMIGKEICSADAFWPEIGASPRIELLLIQIRGYNDGHAPEENGLADCE